MLHEGGGVMPKTTQRDPAQISFTEEIIVDLFAGGGGASTGIEIATGRVVAAAINHDEAAVLLHKTNHPFTEHYRSNVWEVDPLEVCNGRPVGLLWASPDCKHFSKAKGRDGQRSGGADDLGHWPEIRALLNRYCGYELADDELILLNIAGVWYYISDIGLRMLTPRELYAAMGFPADYAIDRDYLGNEYPKDQQIAKCGNSVPPPLAEAMVRANLPEWCGGKIETMEQLMRVVAV